MVMDLIFEVTLSVFSMDKVILIEDESDLLLEEFGVLRMQLKISRDYLNGRMLSWIWYSDLFFALENVIPTHPYIQNIILFCFWYALLYCIIGSTGIKNFEE